MASAQGSKWGLFLQWCELFAVYWRTLANASEGLNFRMRCINFDLLKDVEMRDWLSYQIRHKIRQ